jgi:hypothetical protein
MTIDLDSLTPDFSTKVKQLLDNCKKRGANLSVYCSIRDPWQQARLYRQSRTRTQINSAIKMLSNNKADFLAQVMEEVGPQYGKWASNSIVSFHSFGNAIDSYVVDKGVAVWRRSNIGYQIYAEEAVKLGLTAGYYFTRSDAVHVQMGNCSVLQKYGNWSEIDKLMQIRFKEINK